MTISTQFIREELPTWKHLSTLHISDTLTGDVSENLVFVKMTENKLYTSDAKFKNVFQKTDIYCGVISEKQLHLKLNK